MKMNTNDILNALSDVKGLKSAEIVEESEVKDGATFAIVNLDIDGDTWTVPAVHYEGEDFIFTPWDWQGWMPGTPEEIDQAEWRVNATKQLAVNMDGLPRIL